MSASQPIKQSVILSISDQYVKYVHVEGVWWHLLSNRSSVSNMTSISGVFRSKCCQTTNAPFWQNNESKKRSHIPWPSTSLSIYFHKLCKTIEFHKQQCVSWIYLYAITAAEENTLIWMGNTFLICVFFESKTNRTSVQTDCTILVFSK